MITKLLELGPRNAKELSKSLLSELLRLFLAKIVL